MPKLWLAQQPAQECLHEACERIVRGFRSPASGSSCWLERLTSRANALSVQRVLSKNSIEVDDGHESGR